MNGIDIHALRIPSTEVIHGGPDLGPPVVWDFSTNANALPLPTAMRHRLLDADRAHYPEPSYAALRAHLARATGSQARCIVPTAGSSEGIRRLTLAAHLQGVKQVWVPRHAYADYAAAAQALGLAVHRFDPSDQAQGDELQAACDKGPVLLWLCEPCNPTGASLPAAFASMTMRLAQGRSPEHSCGGRSKLIVALDRAYAPLRLSGMDAIDADQATRLCWQCWSPNKALGLTGVRAGWIQAPLDDPHGLGDRLVALAPSWVLSAEGVRMLMHWHDEDVQQWLAASRRTLADGLVQQQAMLRDMGWTVHATDVPFFLARPPAQFAEALPRMLGALRERGIKLRDAASFGLGGFVRMRVHEPMARQALFDALRDALGNAHARPDAVEEAQRDPAGKAFGHASMDASHLAACASPHPDPNKEQVIP